MQAARLAPGDDQAEAKGQAFTEADVRFRAVAMRIDDAIEIDGRLDEPAWERATAVTGFVQSKPDEGTPATERTEVHVLYDAETIYIGAILYDRSPEAIIATVMRRDESHDENDAFAVTLDTYHDHRNGFYFETNLIGAIYDAQIIGEGGGGGGGPGDDGGFNRDWDAVWEAEGGFFEGGWMVEMAIPFWSLRYDREHIEAWGINFKRTIRRRSEIAYWAPVSRQYDSTRLSQSGILTGLEEIPPSRNLQVKPFATGGYSRARDPADGAGLAPPPPGDALPVGRFLKDGGVDVKWGLSPNLTLDMTANTDFSQVEADDEQINLTRFSLFFPEKREFFLENAGLFEFGGTSGFDGIRVLGFHSRRIGISESNEAVPLLGGGRLTGKIGRWSIGGLSLQTEGVPGQPSSNYAVGRVRRELGTRSNVGVLVTQRYAGGDDQNRAYGVDGRWALSDETTLDAWWMQTHTAGDPDGASWAGQVAVDWATPTWQVSAATVDVGERFNPEVGFVNRTGIRSYDYQARWTPYPEADWIRNLNPHHSLVYTTDRDGRLLSRNIHLDWDTHLRRGEKLSFAHNRYFEQLDFPFRITPEVSIPTGAYHYSEYEIEAISDRSRAVHAGVTYTWGSFFAGDRTNLEVEGGLRVGARFDMTLLWDRNDIDLPQGGFTTDLVRTRLSYDFSTRLSLAGLVQYNSHDDQLLSNIRLNFIHSPGGDLFVVYNEHRLVDPLLGDTGLVERAIIVKLTHLLRF